MSAQERQMGGESQGHGSQKEKLQKESRCPNPFQSVHRLIVLPDCRARLIVSPQGPQNHLVIAKVSNSLLTTAPELHFLFFSHILSFFSVSF